MRPQTVGWRSSTEFSGLAVVSLDRLLLETAPSFQLEFFDHFDQRQCVLWETRPPITEPGLKEGRTNPLVVAHPFDHLHYVRARAFANVRHGVHEAEPAAYGFRPALFAAGPSGP